MSRKISTRPTQSQSTKSATSRFAPAAFITGTPEAVQRLCDDLAAQAAKRLTHLIGADWTSEATRIVSELRNLGHDLSACDRSDDFQEWEVTWYLPRGQFSLFLVFRSAGTVEVIFRADDAKYTAKA